MANPQQVPALSDAITLLKAGEKDKANAVMRQIVGLDPVAAAPAPAPAPAPDREMDLQVIVYGPDGSTYSSPGAARRAGVPNYTMTPPVAANAPLDPVQGARDANARNQPSAGGLINRNIKNTLTNNNLPMFNPAYAGTIDSGASLSAPPTSNPYYTTGRV